MHVQTIDASNPAVCSKPSLKSYVSFNHPPENYLHLQDGQTSAFPEKKIQNYIQLFFIFICYIEKTFLDSKLYLLDMLIHTVV